MKFGLCLGITCAVFLHALVLLFGGIFFKKDDARAHALQSVDLLSAVEAEEEKTKDKQEKKQDAEEELQTDEEPPPDAEEILRTLDTPLVDQTPALEAASLSAIEAALNGQTGSGEFDEALSFASGGRIGGLGKPGSALDEKLEQAFSLAEIDQKPQAIYQESPVIPSEMRGKKTEGVVSLLFVVDPSGKVESPRVEKASHPAFETPALNALKKWKFEPGVRAGQRVKSKMRITMHFPAS